MLLAVLFDCEGGKGLAARADNLSLVALIVAERRRKSLGRRWLREEDVLTRSSGAGGVETSWRPRSFSKRDKPRTTTRWKAPREHGRDVRASSTRRKRQFRRAQRHSGLDRVSEIAPQLAAAEA
jgi:hypothetical protein